MSLTLVSSVLFMSFPLRPTNVRTIRMMGVGNGIFAELIPPLVGYGVVAFIGFYEPTRYHARPIAYTHSASWAAEVVSLTILFNTLMRGVAGDAAKLSSKERNDMVWKFVKEKFDTRTAAGLAKAVLALAFGVLNDKSHALRR